MKEIYKFGILIFLIFLMSCFKEKETTNLSNFLISHSFNIEAFKIICFVPVDGCSTCIDPSLNYAKGAKKEFLLIMSSAYKKSIDFTLERLKFEHNIFISDFKNIAVQKGLVTPIAPCFYFLKDGKVVKKFDLSTTFDKTSILIEVDKYLNQ